MGSLDPSNETRPTRRRWWRILTGRRQPVVPTPPVPEEELPAEEGVVVPDQVPPEWVDNQTAHRVNR